MTKNKKILYSLLAVLSVAIGVYLNLPDRPKAPRDTSNDVVIDGITFRGQLINHEDPKIRESTAFNMKAARKRAKILKDMKENPHKYHHHYGPPPLTAEDHRIIKELKATIELKRKEYIGKTIDIIKFKDGSAPIKNHQIKKWSPEAVYFYKEGRMRKIHEVQAAYVAIDEESRKKLGMEEELWRLISKYAEAFGSGVRY